MITTNDVMLGILTSAINDVVRETCTRVWCDRGFGVTDDGDAYHSFCRFNMSFSSHGDIDESLADAYAKEIKETAEMVSALNKAEIIVDLDIPNKPVENKNEIRKALTMFLEIGIDFDDYEFLEKLLTPKEGIAQ